MGEDAGFEERRFSAQDGLRLSYRDYGDPLSPGTPLLCLAGLTRNAKDYDGLARRLSARRRVVCPDYRGRGRSDYDPDWRNYRPRVVLYDLVDLLTAADLHRVAVFGTSLGGLLAMALAVATPTRLAGVVLNDVGPDLDSAGLERIRAYVGVDQALSDWPAAVDRVKALFPNLGLESEERWRDFAGATFRRGDDGLLHVDWDVGLAKALDDDGDRPDLWTLFRALAPLPVLAIRGETSDVLTPAVFARMAEVKPDLIRVTVPGVGHAPPSDHPRVEQAIDDFLARIDA